MQESSQKHKGWSSVSNKLKSNNRNFGPNSQKFTYQQKRNEDFDISQVEWKPNIEVSPEYTSGIKSEPNQIPVIYWVRQDFRLHDNLALLEEEGKWTRGGASRFFLQEVLRNFHKSLQKSYNSRLIIRKAQTSSLDVLKSLIKETGARSIFFNRQYEPWIMDRDEEIFQTLVVSMCLFVFNAKYTEKAAGVPITMKSFNALLLYEPWLINPVQEEWIGVGSIPHFMGICSKLKQPASPEKQPTLMKIPSRWPASITIEEVGLYRMPKRKDGKRIDWAVGIQNSWKFTEENAIKCLEQWISLEYKEQIFEENRRRADMNAVSRLSPFIHFGMLSPRLIYKQAKQFNLTQKFIRRLGWRDMAYWELFQFPELADSPLRIAYRKLKWSGTKEMLKAWQKGKTGYPLVDAGMRQLWETGWMHHYVRLVVASFLIEYLDIDWIEGQRWFHDTLVDAGTFFFENVNLFSFDVAINSMMWQNGGGSGLDQWNFVMHPVDAAVTCDPDGEYVRKWIPELQNIEKKFIHRPWECSREKLEKAGVILGETYPSPIIPFSELENRRSCHFSNIVEAKKNGPVSSGGHDLLIMPDEKGQDLIAVPLVTRLEFRVEKLSPSTDPVIKPKYFSKKVTNSTEYYRDSTLNEYTKRFTKERESHFYS